MLNTFTHHNILFCQCTLLYIYILIHTHTHTQHSRDVYFFLNLPSFLGKTAKGK